MSESAGEQAFASALESVDTPADRIAAAAAFIATRAREAGIGSIVVTGGAAVVLATARDFATIDVDLVTPDGDRLDAVLREIGFTRRNEFQHIWGHARLGVQVQVAASFLPPHSATEEVAGPAGEVVQIWSTTDLILDRLAQAVFGGAPERLSQAIALRFAADEAFDEARAHRRATDDGPQMTVVLDEFLALHADLTVDGIEDPDASADATRAFWARLDERDIRS